MTPFRFIDLPEYVVWDRIKQRCRSPRHHRWSAYGGRGIKLCDRWLSFPQFLSDMGPRPSAAHSIERRDVNGDYEPGNCYWATDFEQRRNRRNSRRVEWEGRRVIVADLAREHGLHPAVLRGRLEMGWPVGKALRVKVRRRAKNGAAMVMR